MRSIFPPLLLGLCTVLFNPVFAVAEVPVDLEGYDANCGIDIRLEENLLRIDWLGQDERGHRLILNLSGEGALVHSMAVAHERSQEFLTLIEHVDPVFWVTEGTREVPPGKPPNQFWQVFFDNPHQRAHQTSRSHFELRAATVRSQGQRAVVRIGDVTLGTFRGALEFTFYAGTSLLRVDAVVQTSEPARAFFYDAGIVAKDAPTWSQIRWFDTEGQLRSANVEDSSASADSHLAVRYRGISVDGMHGSLCCFPPPHQFQFPRDYSDNLRFVWYGPQHAGTGTGPGFGIRQNKDGGGAFVPWFNAPPESEQRLGMFLLLCPDPAASALKEMLEYTNGDRFPDLPGYVTFTSHWHMAIAVAALAREGEQRRTPTEPDFVRMFKDMNVNVVHLGEFHGDGHQMDGGDVRLRELAAMFDECRRWSDDRLLLLPGEEVNTFLGLEQEGKHPGHWMSFFPKPVYWIMRREGNQPFVEEHPQYGRVYRVGSRGDMIRLLREEAGLVWAAHPRIKASSWTPDIFRQEDFFIADYWLGGAWKAMPADLSRPKLGERVLDLLDDMANWGHKKYVLGEVDVFKIDHTHELYGHMNVNYLRLDRMPKFEEGWQPILDALRDGQFFVSTGEVLIPEFTVGQQRSGGNLSLANNPTPDLRVELAWTFPLAFAEMVSGDGEKVYRERVDLSHTGAFGKDTLTLQPQLAGRHWVRFEVWDVAANGAFTQPVWIEQ